MKNYLNKTTQYDTMSNEEDPFIGLVHGKSKKEDEANERRLLRTVLIITAIIFGLLSFNSLLLSIGLPQVSSYAITGLLTLLIATVLYKK